MRKPFHATTRAATLLALLVASSAFAMEIIHDSGDAVPSAQYLAQLFTVDMDDPASKPVGLNVVSFPVRTASMTPSVLKTPHTINKPEWLVHPVFLIGADRQSRTWLAANLTRLQQLDALGIVVDADDYAAFRALQQVAVGLPLAPASADGLAPSLGLTVYPVLLHIDGEITQ